MKNGAIIRTNKTTELRYKRSPSAARKFKASQPIESTSVVGLSPAPPIRDLGPNSWYAIFVLYCIPVLKTFIE